MLNTHGTSTRIRLRQMVPTAVVVRLSLIGQWPRLNWDLWSKFIVSSRHRGPPTPSVFLSSRITIPLLSNGVPLQPSPTTTTIWQSKGYWWNSLIKGDQSRKLLHISFWFSLIHSLASRLFPDDIILDTRLTCSWKPVSNLSVHHQVISFRSYYMNHETN